MPLPLSHRYDDAQTPRVIEEEATIQLYKECTGFRIAITADLTGRYPDLDRRIVVQTSQKLVERLLLLLFARASGMLPPSASDEASPLYDGLKKSFTYLNSVLPKTCTLFEPDPILDTVTISEAVLEIHLRSMSRYDFASQVDVNILGHVFENSIAEIERTKSRFLIPDEQIKTGLSATTKDKPIGRRKREGIYYTPRSITTYIVQHTLGALCTEERARLHIDDASYAIDKNRSKKATEQLDQKLLDYRSWLLTVTICDPACGSGAFLSAALDFLIREHRTIDELRAKLYGGMCPLFDNIEIAVLENNLYGVDISEESVEIAKLVLWLRTEGPGRKLNSLGANIVCGNSLVSDPAVAGNKAFDWARQFPKVIEQGGFDVVIGNPPYVFAREKLSETEKEYYARHYKSAMYQFNTYILFMEKSMLLCKENGACGLIVPNSWLMVYSGEQLRRFLLERCTLTQIASLLGKSFEAANVETVIFIARNTPSDAFSEVAVLKNNDDTSDFSLLHRKRQAEFSEEAHAEFRVFACDACVGILRKMRNGCRNLDDVCSVKSGLIAYEAGRGVPKQSADDVRNRPYDFRYQYNQDTHPYLEGSDVSRFGLSWSGTWLWHGRHLAEPRPLQLFAGAKIIVREIAGPFPRCVVAAWTDQCFLFNTSNIAVIGRPDQNFSLKYVLAILNSSLMSYYFLTNTAKAQRKLFPKLILKDLRLFPIKDIPPIEQEPLAALADTMLDRTAKLLSMRQRFLRRVSDTFPGVRTTKALGRFDELGFPQFVGELQRQKAKLSLKAQDEWEEYFGQYKRDCLALRVEMNECDGAIDQMVFALYGLGEEDRAEVERCGR